MDQSFPMVTIAIPTFNRANSYLPLALQSGLNQTYPQIEIIVSDNCSSDNTEQFVKSFADPRIRYFKQPHNIGPKNNTDFCLAKASGDYFLLLHDDDLIDKDYIEACIEAAGYNTNTGIIRTGVRSIDGEGGVLRNIENPAKGLSIEEFFLAWFDGRIPMFLSGTLFNTKHLQEVGGFDPNFAPFEDVAAELQLAANFGRVDIKEIKASFREHTSSQTSSTDMKQWITASVKLFDMMCGFVLVTEAFLKRGRIFFAHHNYSLAAKIRVPLIRVSAYVQVYQTYGYPLKLLFSRNAVLRLLWRLSTKAWKLLDSAMSTKTMQ